MELYQGPEKRPAPRRWKWLFVVAALVAWGIIGYWRWGEPAAPVAVQTKHVAVPVVVAQARRRDMPVHVSGLGSVQASKGVTIRSQVDGVLEEVLFTEGQHVKKGDVLAKIDPRLYQAALEQAQGRKAQDEAQLIAANKDLTRFKTLGARGIETQQNVDQQQGKVDQLKAAIETDQAAIDSAQTQLDYTAIVAPLDGRVGIRIIDPGNLVHASDQTPLVSIMQTHPIAVVFTLPAGALNDVRDAMQRGPVQVTAFDADDRRALASGTLLLIDNTIDQATSTMRLKAMFDNKDDELWPGEFVNARVLLETRDNALTIPSVAVQRGPQGLFAWVVTGSGTAEMRPIEVGPASDDQTVVTSGLGDGDRVVTDGQYKLQQGIAVAVSSSPAPVAANPS